MYVAARLKQRHVASTKIAPVAIRAMPPRPIVQGKTGCTCGGGCPACQKRQIAGPDHPAEREADAVAARVMAMAAPVHGSMLRSDPETLMRQPETGDNIQETVQRQEEEEEAIQAQMEDDQEDPLQRQVDEEAEEEEGEVQMSADTQGGACRPPARPLAGLGGGQPLPTSLRGFFEPRFGRSFADVRIHEGAAAGRRARYFNARAFTFGLDIVFGAGRYDPETPAGRHLLAHELTHVVQQRQKDEN